MLPTRMAPLPRSLAVTAALFLAGASAHFRVVAQFGCDWLTRPRRVARSVVRRRFPPHPDPLPPGERGKSARSSRPIGITCLPPGERGKPPVRVPSPRGGGLGRGGSVGVRRNFESEPLPISVSDCNGKLPVCTPAATGGAQQPPARKTGRPGPNPSPRSMMARQVLRVLGERPTPARAALV